MESSDVNSPLLNEYKLAYLSCIIPQTFLGGLRVRFSFKAPWYVYCLQLLLWSYPLIIGCLLTMILEIFDSQDRRLYYGISCGIVLYLCPLTLNFLLLYFSRKKAVTQPVVTNNFLMEEDEVIFTKCLSFVTFDFVVGKKQFLPNILIHPLVYGVTAGLVFLFLQPSRTLKFFGNQTGASVYFAAGWIVSCISLYPLIGQPPKEPNAFRFTDKYDLVYVTRSFYVFVLAVLEYVLIYNFTFMKFDLELNNAVFE